MINWSSSGAPPPTKEKSLEKVLSNSIEEPSTSENISHKMNGITFGKVGAQVSTAVTGGDWQLSCNEFESPHKILDG